MIAASIVFGVILRSLMLVWPKSFWGDEWASVQFATAPLWDTLLMSARDTHPPLYFLALNAAARFIDWGVWVLRVPSLVIGIGALLSCWMLGRELLDRRTLRIFVWMAALSPILVHYSYLARNHGALVLFCTLATFCFVRMNRSKSDRRWSACFVITALAAVYSQHFAWIWLLTLFALKPSRIFLAVILGALPMIGLFFYNLQHYDRHYLLIPFSEYEPAGSFVKMFIQLFEYVSGPPLNRNFIDPPFLFIFAQQLLTSVLKKVLFGVWLCASAGGIVLLARQWGKRQTVILCLPIAALYAISAFHFMYMETNYHPYLAVPVLFLFAFGVSHVFRARAVRWGIIACFSAVMLLKTAVLIQTHASVRFDEDHWRSLDRIYSQCQPGDMIANVDDDQYLFNRRWKPVPEGVRWIENAANIEPKAFLPAPRVWVIGTDTIGDRLAAAGYRKVRSYHLRREYVALYFNPHSARMADET